MTKLRLKLNIPGLPGKHSFYGNTFWVCKSRLSARIIFLSISARNTYLSLLFAGTVIRPWRVIFLISVNLVVSA